MFIRSHTIALTLALMGTATAHAASAYTETWNDGTVAGWVQGTTSSSLSNPADYLEVSRINTDFGTAAGTSLAAATGDFSGSAWTVSVDLARMLTPDERLLEAIFGAKTQDAWLRLRYNDSSFNGWRYQLSDKLDTDWTTYTVTFDAGWTDAEAMAHGWVTDLPDGAGSVSWAETLQNVYQTSLRFELSNTQRIGVDNFVLAPVPEPGTWALALTGLVGLAWRLRAGRRPDNG
jgi:hypothetical protein